MLGSLPSVPNLFRVLTRKAQILGDGDLLEPLLPVADRETYQRYASAFDTIIEKDVTCVAVTGPYGAGKTSLINAFKENYPKLKFIRISLATFEGDSEKSISSDMIEKSILQQLIYSAGRKKLEYSRFKKIRKPRWLHAKAFLLSVFAVSTGAAVIYWQEVEGFLVGANRWQEFTAIATAGAFWLLLLFLTVHGTLKASAGLSIKKFSLKNAEIETEDKSKESVFNKHLDEIVYFFQETPCDVVVIEDLDRFGKTEIFTKIREINQLINANPDVRPRSKKKIIFLFAIRDDLFQGKDRTKFFDLLIPVIPYVSAGNAYDALHNKLVKVGLREGLQDKFLRQVTIYVTDNRHLVNIVNEYSLYTRNLFAPNLDPNKLFAIILYKVFFPSDFGKLHMNKGVLADLVGELQERRREKREGLTIKLKEINEAAKQIREGQINSHETLASAYVGAIERRSNGHVRGFRIPPNGHEFNIKDDTESILGALKTGTAIQVIGQNGGRLDQLDMSEIAGVIHPGLTLRERLRLIDRNAQLEEQDITATRTELEGQLRDVRYLPIDRAFSKDEIRAKIATFDHGDLFIYLVTEGRLGEDYDYYTSYFHKGATTRADREFVQRFNKGDEIDFAEKIDTPHEILLILEDGLFGKPQGFNITLVDHVLGNENQFQNGLIAGVKAFQGESLRFLQAYYLEGQHVEKLLRMLLTNWDGFLDAASECTNPLPHVKEILEKAQEGTISGLRKPNSFIDFIERSASDIFDSPKLVDRIPLLIESGALIGEISFPNLQIADRGAAISTVAEHSLWKITPQNVATILAWQGVETLAAQSAMFLSLGKAPKSVFTYIEANINSFIERCFLEVDSTIAEPQQSLEKMLSVQGLREEIGNRVIARQQALLRFSEVPRAYWATIVEEQKYVIDWENFNELLIETGDFANLAPIFRSADVISEIAKNRKKIRVDLFGYLVDFDDMNLESYQKLIGPDLGTISEFPTTIDSSKKLHLIRSGMIELSENAWNWLQGSPTLRVVLIEERLSKFEDIEDWVFEKEELSGLLKSKIPRDVKRRLLVKAETVECGEDVRLRTEVANILNSPDTTISDFDEDFVESVIEAAPKEVAIELLVRMIPNWEETRVMRNLQAIGSPYGEIADYGKRPTISDTTVNVALAEAMQKRDMISQFKKSEERGIRIITKRNEPSE
jgi:hypothetical protein